MIAILLAMGVLLGLGGLSIGGEGGSAEGSDDPEALLGSDGDDTIRGGGGSDLVVGFAGDDLLSGDGGNDWIFGLNGADTITGGDGNDVISGGRGADVIYAGAGDDFVESAGILDDGALTTSVKGARTFGDVAFLYDFSRGYDEGDIIDLGPGNDTVVAGAGDTITTGGGSDEIALGDWSRGGAPVVITDFDPDQDVITYAHETSRAEPVFETFVNPISGDAELTADGEVFAVIRNAGPEFEPVQILRRSYAA
ncbi:calcium-binding protein [Lacimonas salitolerans]|uniref:Calcium-binding protein n=1 Tax=Lacimonas salitolerans TaxID=1323750 RepID=A0ABW4ENH9_9RHOB